MRKLALLALVVASFAAVGCQKKEENTAPQIDTTAVVADTAAPAVDSAAPAADTAKADTAAKVDTAAKK